MPDNYVPQYEDVKTVNTAPSGACTLPNTLVKCNVGVDAGVYQCIDGAWQKVAGVGVIKPGTLYSAAGTPLPTATTALKGAQAVVSDADTPTYGGAYDSGGATVAAVICDGTGWFTH